MSLDPQRPFCFSPAAPSGLLPENAHASVTAGPHPRRLLHAGAGESTAPVGLHQLGTGGRRWAGRTLTRAAPVTDTLFGQAVTDSYRWLEDEKSAEVQAWMAAQDSAARAFLDGLAGRAALTARLEALAYAGVIGLPEKRGARLFFTKRGARQEKAVLYFRDSEAGEDKMLLDPNGWDGGKTALGVWRPSWDGKQVAFAQHPNNADEAVLHVIDVENGKWSSADVLEGAKYADPSWTPDGRGFYYEYLPNPPGTSVADRPGLTEIRFHRLGQPQAQDALVRGATHDATTFLAQELSRDGKVLLLYVQHGWTRNDVYLKRLGTDRDFRPSSSDSRPAMTSPSGRASCTS